MVNDYKDGLLFPIFAKMKESATFAIHTLGCKLNYAESSTIAHNLIREGYSKVYFKDKADIYIINTCSVTNEADKECRQVVRAALNTSPDAYIAVIGCYAQLKPEEIIKIDGVSLVLGASEKFNLIRYLKTRDDKNTIGIHSCEIENPLGFYSAYSSGERTRSFLKVQDGCDYNCSYCTIPIARGASRSDTIANIISNIFDIAAQGIKEIVLTGVNLGDFGKHSLQKESFLELIKEIEKINLPLRFRISSIEPNLLTNEIIEHVAVSSKFVPHFHIPLQSGSNDILKAMRRRYLRELYVERVSYIKSLLPYCCIGADVIVGFPGETEQHFNETYSYLSDIDVSYLHVFTYSERSNTVAAENKEIVPMHIRKERNKKLRSLSEKKLRRFYEQNLGRKEEVLFESPVEDGYLYGYTSNYIRVKIKNKENYTNRLFKVVLNTFNQDGTLKACLFPATTQNP